MNDSEKKTPRRRLRITLRTLLIAVTALCLFLGWYATRARQQQQAVRWLMENECVVVYDYQIKQGGSGIALEASPPYPKWLVDLVGVDFFANATSVQIRNCKFEDLSQLNDLRSLRYLMIDNTSISDLSPLSNMKELSNLSLENSPVVDLRPLAGLTNLEGLTVKGTQVNDLTPLAYLKNLTHLILQGEVSKNGRELIDPFDLEMLNGFPKLEYLELTDCVVNDLTPLSKKENLSELYLTDVKYEDENALRKSSNIDLVYLSIE